MTKQCHALEENMKLINLKGLNKAGLLALLIDMQQQVIMQVNQQTAVDS